MSVTIQNGGNSIKISTQGPAGPQGAQGEQGIQGIQGEPGPAGSNEWGTITGLLENQTDLNTVLGELETASDTNESNLNTHIADTDIHFSDAPSDGSQYARQDGNWSVVDAGGASSGDDTDITGLLHGDGSTLSAATAAEVRAAADLDTTDSPTFDDLTLTGDILSSAGISLAPNGTDPATDSLQLAHSGDYISMNALGNGLYFRTNNVVRGTLFESGSLQWRHDVIGYDSTQNIGNDTTGRFNTVYADAVDLTSDISLSDGATIDVGGGTGDLTIDGDLTMTGTINVPPTPGSWLNNTYFTSRIDGGAFYFRGAGGAKRFLFENCDLLAFAHNNPFGIDTGFSATAAGEVSLGNGSRGDASGTLKLADIVASGDISLSDGAEINIGSTAGTADILGQITITPDGLYDQAISINGGNITLRSDGAMGCKSLTISTLRNYIHSSGPRVCNANVIGFVDHTSNAVSYSPNAAFSYGNPTNNNDRNGGAVVALGNGTAQDASGTLQLAKIEATGDIDFSGLPTSDPAVAGRLWNDSGTLKVSAG